MRISDWSSTCALPIFTHRLVFGGDISKTRQRGLRDGTVPPFGEVFPTRAFPSTDFTRAGLFAGDEISIADGRLILYPALRFDWYDLRSEEHTSELQSLMRLSYAVFCLTKKKKKKYTRLLITYSCY